LGDGSDEFFNAVNFGALQGLAQEMASVDPNGIQIIVKDDSETARDRVALLGAIRCSDKVVEGLRQSTDRRVSQARQAAKDWMNDKGEGWRTHIGEHVSSEGARLVQLPIAQQSEILRENHTFGPERMELKTSPYFVNVVPVEDRLAFEQDVRRIVRELSGSFD